ncbi:MAG: RDD family protein [Campylobacterota bacterium]|nr:RDD family protein [Campylobacterota bacterium]
MDNNIQNDKIDTSKLQLSSIKSRIKAFVIDDLSITLLVILILWDQIEAANGDLLVILTVMNAAFFQIIIIKFIYQTFFIWYYGATIGKFIAKIRVIDFDNYGKVSLVNSAIRSSGRIVSEAIFYIGFLVANYTESKQTFHDKIGKTLVVDA